MRDGATDDNGQKLLEPGEMFGDYTVERLLGKGGMGAVYLVRAPGGERYAVKVMFPDMVKKGSDYRKRFAREAEFAMKIRHTNLISVFDVGEDPETGLCYIIMDYVPGGSVADRLDREGAFPMAEAVSIAAQVALALEVAHRHGVIHRDIKPDNIMFDEDGTPKLADLGVAKFTDSAHKTTVTTTGMIIGTPAYMAPEQMMDSHHIDARADIYALGVVLYEMLTGKHPNEGSTAVELLAKALKGEPLPDVRTMRPEVSAAIAHVLSLMCAPKPENRPATALAAAQLLQKAITGRLSLPKKSPRAADAAARKKDRRFSFAAIAVIAGFIALCASVTLNLLNKSPQRIQPVLVQSVTMTNVIERTVVITNLVERELAVTNLGTRVAEERAMPVSSAEPPVTAESKMAAVPPAPAKPEESAVPTVQAKAEEAVVPYVSRSKLHALYRSKDRSHVFVEVCHADEGGSYATPCCTVDRLREAIDNKAEILFVTLACSKDGVLFSAKDPGFNADLAKVSDGIGRFGDHIAADLKRFMVCQEGRLTTKNLSTFEDLLQIGKGRILFKVDHLMENAMELEMLLERLDAWESVILQTSNSKTLAKKYGEKMLGKMKTGELIVSCVKDSFPPTRQLIPEATADASYRKRMREQNLRDIPQRVFASMVHAERTDDEAGWNEALNDGATVLRTRRPRDLILHLEKRNGIDKGNDVSMAQTQDDRPAKSAKVVIFPIAAPRNTKWKSRAPWRYVTQFPGPQQSGANWMDPMFRDSDWKRTNKPLGAGMSRELMRIADRWNSSRLYLRKHFAWKGGKVTRVEFTLYHACAVRIYLNGTLILETDERNDWWEKMETPVEAFSKALRNGDNVLAIEAQDIFGNRYLDWGLTLETEAVK